jgi:hypothetical protein
MHDYRLKLYRGVYAAVRADGKGGTDRVSLRTRDPGEARRRLTDWTTRPAGENIADLVAVYAADKDKTSIRSVDIHRCWKNAATHFGPLRPDQITREICRAYASARTAQGRQAATIRKEISTVRAAVNFNKRGGGDVWELPRAPAQKDRALSRLEARALVKAARGTPHVRAFMSYRRCAPPHAQAPSWASRGTVWTYARGESTSQPATRSIASAKIARVCR